MEVELKTEPHKYIEDLEEIESDHDDLILEDEFSHGDNVLPTDKENSLKCNSGHNKTNGDSISELSFASAQLSAQLIKKKKDIIKVLESKPLDSDLLHSFALSQGGFVSDDLRRKAWPLLLGIDVRNCSESSKEELESHPEYHQVVMDVNRSLKRFPPGIPLEQRIALQDQLTRLIMRVIIKYPDLRYYQGYHDVAVTFLLVVGETAAFLILEKLSMHHLRDCMEPTMDRTEYLLNHIYPLLKRLSPNLHSFMEKSEVGTLFCLPWFLTWFGHNLNQYHHLVRLYDYFLASPPLFPLYFAAVLVFSRESEILKLDCDMANVHCLLSQIPDQLPFEELLEQSAKLYEQFPPESIEDEVQERTQRQLALRQAQSKVILSKRLAQQQNYGIFWYLFQLNRLMPRVLRIQQPVQLNHWRFPHWRSPAAFVTASLVIGFYAYMRSTEAAVIRPER